MTLPTFVIGGAPKAGTTALWALLAEHPDVWMSRLKEPYFLTRDVNNPAPGVRIIGAPRTNSYPRGLEWYESLFAEGADRRARGEASTHYIGALDGPELMERHVPGLKVIFILRQPVDRMYSHYWHNEKRGHSLPPFRAVLEDHPDLRYLEYMSRYGQHVERYRQALGPDRVHLVLFDDLRTRPAEVFREVCRFIEVDDSFQPDFAAEHNPYGTPASRSLQRAITRTTYMRWTFLPEGVRRSARRMRIALQNWNLRRAAYRPIDEDVRRQLQDHFELDISYVERLTRPLPEWRPGA